eukprot:m.71924 g.71924  ORF g.71924 m.71924 type:complete len:563 (-) comp12290_c0_seq1:108-1796(-)
MSSKQTREDFRKLKELDEARKAGTAPAEVDEDGKDINPHIPQYISKAPWYLQIDRPTLSHQRQDDEKKEIVTPIEEVDKLKKGVRRDAPRARKFRKGACENCGAMTHKKKECTERPRKIGAKHNSKNISRDEYLPDTSVKLNYDGRHDNWKGYDPAMYQRVIEEHNKIEREKRRVQAEQQKEQDRNYKEGEKNNDDSDSDSDSDVGGEKEEEKYADQATMIAKFDAKNRVSVRNLRIREDTAKYLRNLDLNSAHYDPKTRTMRSNPYAGTGLDAKSVTFAGDNFVRYDEKTREIGERQIFAWEAQEKGEDIHVQADPTLAEMMHKKHKNERENFKGAQRESVLAKYGGAEHLKAPPKELLLAQSEHYVEYSKGGRLIKGQEKAVAKSKYEEDQFPGNHQSVWGSFWRDGRWGYACCHSFVRESYCTGEQGKLAAAQTNALSAAPTEPPPDHDKDEKQKTLVEEHKEKLALANKKEGKKKKKRNNDEDDDEASREKVRQKKIKEAMERQEREDREASKLMGKSERDWNYGAAIGGVDKPTEEEMEAYRLRQRRADDPMSQFES